MQTYTREREQGTIETLPGSAKDRINAIRQVVEARQYAKIDGQMMDLFSASAIMTVYNALSPQSRMKFAGMPAPKMALLAFKLVK